MKFGNRQALRTGAFLLCSAVAFAQSSAFGQASAGAATEAVFIAKNVSIIIVIVCGLWMAATEGHNRIVAICGMMIGLIFALFASPIVTWVQSL